MRLLFLTPQLPFPARQGAAIRNAQLIAGMAREHEVSLLTFVPDGMEPGSLAGADMPSLPGAPRLARLTLVGPPQRRLADRLHTLLLTGLPDMARRLWTPEFAGALQWMLRADPYDWVILEGIEMAPYRQAVRTRLLFDEHNAEYLLQARAALSDLHAAYRPRAALGTVYSLVQALRLRRYERTVCRAADAVTAVSDADRDALRRLAPGIEVSVVSNGVDLEEWSVEAAPHDPEMDALCARGPLLVFDGSMDFRPNVDAVVWFCRECWPRIRAAQPTATFAIVGRNPTQAVRALAELPGVLVTGAVHDTRPWVAAADVYVVPMRIGGGVRLKLLQALAMSRAVVSTPLGAEGVALRPGRDLLLANTATDFSASVLSLLDNPPRRDSLGRSGRLAVAAYSWERIVPLFASVVGGQWSVVSGQRSAVSDQPSATGTRASRSALHTPHSAMESGTTHYALRTTLVMTVRNEAGSIGGVIESLRGQTRGPDEMVIVDGGSSDDTVGLIEAAAGEVPWPLWVRVVPGANISQGRNAAIREAKGPIITVTDAGVRLPETWLERLVAPFEGSGGAEIAVASGFFSPDPQTVFERAMGATVLPALADIKPERFLPSSRSVAFRKDAWEAVGGYPEWLDYSEDLVFDIALRDAGYRFAFVPDATALFRPRGSLRAFFRQYYLYARGDGKADLWRRRHAIRYATYVAASILLLLARKRPFAWLLLAVGAGAYCAVPYRRLRPWLAGLTPAERAQAIALVPIIRLTGDCAKMAGYPVGVLWWRGKTRKL
ncbi:MAG: glycosyltransferase [Chloroflexia bacterium]